MFSPIVGPYPLVALARPTGFVLSAGDVFVEANRGPLAPRHCWWLTNRRDIQTAINRATRIPTTNDEARCRRSMGSDPAPFCAAPMPNQKRRLPIARIPSQSTGGGRVRVTDGSYQQRNLGPPMASCMLHLSVSLTRLGDGRRKPRTGGVIVACPAGELLLTGYPPPWDVLAWTDSSPEHMNLLSESVRVGCVARWFDIHTRGRFEHTY